MRERFKEPVTGTAGVLVTIILIGFVIWIALRARPSRSPAPATGTPAAESVSASRPEATIAPSATPTSAAAASLTPSPAPSDTATRPPPTPEPESTLDIPATVMAVAAPTRQRAMTAPDGRWQVEHLLYPCSELPGTSDVLAYERLDVVDTASGAATKVADQLLSCGGLGAFGLEGLFWSDNGRFFYFTTAREGVPDGCGYWQRPLLRYAVETEESEWLGPGERSPDGTKVAAWQERDLVIWHVGGEEIGRSPAAVPDADLGTIAWSPAGDALVYLQAPSYCPLEKSYLVHVTVAGMEPTVLFEAEAPPFGDVAWLDGGLLRLVDEDGEEWIYNLANGELNPAR